MWVIPWNRSFPLMLLWGSLGCLSHSYFLVREESTDPFALIFFLCQGLLWWSWKSLCPALCCHLPSGTSMQAAVERQSAVYNDPLQSSRPQRRPRQGQNPAFCLFYTHAYSVSGCVGTGVCVILNPTLNCLMISHRHNHQQSSEPGQWLP